MCVFHVLYKVENWELTFKIYLVHLFVDKN